MSSPAFSPSELGDPHGRAQVPFSSPLPSCVPARPFLLLPPTSTVIVSHRPRPTAPETEPGPTLRHQDPPARSQSYQTPAVPGGDDVRRTRRQREDGGGGDDRRARAAMETKPPPGGRDEAYSDLEVVETGPEVLDTSHLPEVARAHHHHHHHHYHHDGGYAEDEGKHHSPQPQALRPGSEPESAPPYSGGSASSLADHHRYNGGHNPFGSAERPPRDDVILGLRRKVFWTVLALFVAGIVMGLAVGLGVGLGVGTGSSSASTPTASSASTTVLPVAVATATADASTEILCPAANRTLYTLATSAAGRSRRFLVLCGRDYNSDGGAQDMVSVNTTDFEGCLGECGATDGCTAVGWGNYYGVNTCWLKSAVGSPSWSSGWYAAVEEEKEDDDDDDDSG